ncbi:MAG TPA: M48 family metallopeptidase, partial [Micromonosporaceae bacterium]|nr:M48 family metallopeptidase [Micromonosporaceae bacterium]
MVTTVRAAISVALLAGFYVLAVGLIAGLAALAVWLWREHPGGAAAKLSYVAIALAAGVVIALWRVVRTRPEPALGLLVPRERAPELWSTVSELAVEAGTRAPDEIRLIPEVNAAVSEDASLLGLRAGRRYIYLGVPLLQALTVTQLRAVLAHELGHYSHSHTRLGALSYRGRMTIIRTIEHIGPHSFLGYIFRAYAVVYLLAEHAVSRRQEFEADRTAVRVAGKAAAASALRELPVLDAAWNRYFERYVSWGWEAGYAPADLLGGFHRLLAERAGELAALRTEALGSQEAPVERSRWDSHPPIPDRIAAIEAGPDPGIRPDDRPAGVLVSDLDAVCRALQAEVVDPAGRTVLGWPEFTAAAAVARDQHQADILFRAAARLAGTESADLGTVLDLVEAGRGEQLGKALAPHAADRFAALAGYLTDAVRLAAVRSGVARWRHSWAAPAALVDGAGD